MFENLSKINYLFLYLCLINSTLQAAYRASTFEKVKSQARVEHQKVKLKSYLVNHRGQGWTSEGPNGRWLVTDLR